MGVLDSLLRYETAKSMRVDIWQIGLFYRALQVAIFGYIINGLIVGGFSRAAGGIGRIFGRLQSGNLQGYVALFGLGVILVIYLTVFVS